jgi:hypothetical protein
LYFASLRVRYGLLPSFYPKAILSDPVVRQVIQDLSTNDPKSQAAGNKAMRDPVMGAKINKLIAAGVLQTG